MAGNNRLQVPPIFVDTSVSFSPSRKHIANSIRVWLTRAIAVQQSNLSSSSAASSSTAGVSQLLSEGGSAVERRPSSNDGTYLTAGSPTSMDGETLRSRANSFAKSFDSHAPTLQPTPSTSMSTAAYDDVPLSEALKPDQRNEKDFHVENNPFAFSPGQLNKMLNPKSLAAFRALGGLRGLEKGLRTDLNAGLSLDESHLEGHVTFEEATRPDTGSPDKQVGSMTAASESHSRSGSQFMDRLRVFDCNKLPEKKADGFLVLFWRAYNDKIIILLTIAAVISLALGLYETFAGHSKVDWIEGVAICVAILIVTVVTAVNDWQKEKQFIKLNRRVRSFKHSPTSLPLTTCTEK